MSIKTILIKRTKKILKLNGIFVTTWDERNEFNKFQEHLLIFYKNRGYYRYDAIITINEILERVDCGSPSNYFSGDLFNIYSEFDKLINLLNGNGKLSSFREKDFAFFYIFLGIYENNKYRTIGAKFDRSFYSAILLNPDTALYQHLNVIESMSRSGYRLSFYNNVVKDFYANNPFYVPYLGNILNEIENDINEQCHVKGNNYYNNNSLKPLAFKRAIGDAKADVFEVLSSYPFDDTIYREELYILLSAYWHVRFNINLMKIVSQKNSKIKYVNKNQFEYTYVVSPDIPQGAVVNTTDLESYINSIINYRNKAFPFINNNMGVTSIRDCMIYLDEDNGVLKNSLDSIKRELDNYKTEVYDLCTMLNATKEYELADCIKVIWGCRALMTPFNPYGTINDAAEVLAKRSQYGKMATDLLEIIRPLNIQYNNLVSALGVFRPGDNSIHLFYDKIYDYANINSIDIKEFTESILAHEMMHSFHYADVCCNGSEWSDRLECSAVKETIAEYYNLYYTKGMGLINCCNDILTNRKKTDFPYDGGYSGALLLDYEVQNGITSFDIVYNATTVSKNFDAAYNMIK